MKFKSFLVAGLIVLVLVGVLAGIRAMQIGTLMASGAAGGAPPSTVSTALVETARWESTVESVGSLRAVQGAELSTEAAGVVSKILFENGQEVNKGDLLLELDSSSEQANLRSAEAEQDLARTVYERTKRLRVNSAVPQSDMDTAESQLRKMTALAEQLRANISKKQIVAPFSGRLGIRDVNLGQYVDHGSKVVSLQSLDPIYVDFLLPQQLIAGLRLGSGVRVYTDVYPGRVFEGKLTAINSEIDQVTRNIRLQATLGNHDGALRPGMFARVILTLGEAEEVIRIPSTALLREPYGDSVFVVVEKTDDEGVKSLVAEQRFVRTGRSQGDFVAVTKGLKPGETVVSAGAFKLRNGVVVNVDNTLAPQPQMEPQPSDT